MAQLITQRAGEPYDWQYEVISRIERDGGDPGDPETWDKYSAEVAETEEAIFTCATCGGSGWITLTEYPTPQGETTTARCIECAGS
jgi:hypothetical protein